MFKYFRFIKGFIYKMKSVKGKRTKKEAEKINEEIIFTTSDRG
jgi:hypothetical protein